MGWICTLINGHKGRISTFESRLMYLHDVKILPEALPDTPADLKQTAVNEGAPGCAETRATDMRGVHMHVAVRLGGAIAFASGLLLVAAWFAAGPLPAP
jgi:hypothetical protein